MDAQWKKLLAEHDDPKNWECPSDFSHDEADKRFAKFVAELEVSLCCRLETETGGHIQDASFHSRILFGDDGASLRFSRFGSMIAFTPDFDYLDTIRAGVSSLAERLGYVLVPSEILEEAYSGSNPGVTGIETWWIRYFNWV